jgi:uncharacterized oxidoreductase
MHYVNVVGHPAQVAPFGGSQARLNTNPYCCAVPAADGEPVVLDMATSTIALGKVREAMGRSDTVPEGSLIDSEGRPTTDPSVMFGPPEQPKGALTSFGLHKGSGLSLICELLGGVMAAAWPLPKPYDGPPTVYNGMLAILLSPAALGDADAIAQEVIAVRQYMRETKPAADSTTGSVQVPGDPERASRKQRSAEGIPLSDGTWKELCAIADNYKLDAQARDALLAGKTL